jgi:acetyl esterase/lipase
MTFLELYKTDVRIERDIRYLESDDERHRLDIYAPPDASGLPVALYFYGGGWRSGDKRLFEHLGRALAVRGIVTLAVNYRLTPAVKSPAHAEDCAAAAGWVHRNIGSYGGDPERLVLTGHSAGAHLAALVGTAPGFLAEVGVPESAVRGVVMISGATDLRSHVGSIVFTSREFVEQAFGSTPEELGAASPMTYVRPGLPPFLVIVAEDDPPGLREQGKMFAEALRDAGNEVIFISVKGRDHFSIVRRFGPSDDTTANAVAEFVHHVTG